MFNTLLMTIAAVSTVALVACAPRAHDRSHSSDSAASGIIGGTVVNENNPIAKMSGMLVNAKEGSLCTVSIISDEWMLTAGHCVQDAQTTDLYVIFSGTFQDLIDHKIPAANIRKVAGAFPNPGYAQTLQKLVSMQTKARAQGKELSSQDLDGVKSWGDIGLIHLAGKIPAGKTIAPMLPTTVQLQINQTVTLAGYGQTSSSKESTYGVLNQVDVAVVDPTYGGTEVEIDNTVRGACHGDSGGPAYAKVNGELYLFGVTSRGVGDSAEVQCVHNTVYTNVLSYQSWIAQTMAAGH